MGMKKLAWKGLLLLGVLALFIQGFTKIDLDTKDDFIGLQLWSVKDDMKKDPKATVAKVGEMGYQFVEAAGYSDGKFYGMSPAEFKKAM